MRFFPLTAIIALLYSSAASADLVVDSPHFDKGTLSFSDNNSALFDGSRSHTLGASYGFTGWWQATLQADFDKAPGAPYTYANPTVQNQFAFFAPGEYWLDTGMELNYIFSHQANTLESKLLLEKAAGPFVNDANLVFDRQIGGGRAGGLTASLAWKTQYQYTDMFNPGFEYYGDFTAMGDSGRQRQLGPVFYGDLGHGVGYELGWLFGLSKAAADNTIKLNLSLAFPL